MVLLEMSEGGGRDRGWRTLNVNVTARTLIINGILNECIVILNAIVVSLNLQPNSYIFDCLPLRFPN